jgi:hypothetical protein
MAKRIALTINHIRAHEFIYVYDQAVTNKNERDVLSGFHEAVLSGTSPSEQTVNWVKDLSMSLIGEYKNTAMLGIPFMEEHESYQLELDLGFMDAGEMYLHNNEKQLHHLVHVLYLLSDKDVTLELPSLDVSVILNSNRVLLYPANFTYRYILSSTLKRIPYVCGALAFQKTTDDK